MTSEQKGVPLLVVLLLRVALLLIAAFESIVRSGQWRFLHSHLLVSRFHRGGPGDFLHMAEVAGRGSARMPAGPVSEFVVAGACLTWVVGCWGFDMDLVHVGQLVVGVVHLAWGAGYWYPGVSLVFVVSGQIWGFAAGEGPRILLARMSLHGEACWTG